MSAAGPPQGANRAPSGGSAAAPAAKRGGTPMTGAPAPRMLPLAAMPDAVRHAIRGVLADIDDTLTTHGRLTATAYAALERLRAAGKLVIPITGRPAGW